MKYKKYFILYKMSVKTLYWIVKGVYSVNKLYIARGVPVVSTERNILSRDGIGGSRATVYDTRDFKDISESNSVKMLRYLEGGDCVEYVHGSELFDTLENVKKELVLRAALNSLRYDDHY